MMKNSPLLSRRNMLKLTSGSLLTVPFMGLQGCNFPFSAGKAHAAVFDTLAPSKPQWASGGTSAITDIPYSNPLLDDPLGNLCRLVEPMTKGPCYSTTQVRQDISEGRDGLPMRLWFKIVDERCQPVAGANVDIWHCDPYGIYSGDDMRSVNFCTTGNKAAQAHDWFRGVQTTDENGLVYFESCFPGWYVMRAVHIHLIISKEQQSVTTQVGFDDALVGSITMNEAIYYDRGAPAISNITDSVFPHNGDVSYFMETEQLADKTMLAWKTFAVGF
ncbi:dioxygenase family protein [Marinomonas transparens]|uniref:Intradiol ring-cleavage dioxygenase n=1 Tax=Marinomonas transparens TaxID=2795388 RepID=A0A934JNQ0_9GAMM|nr:intradiol ring-cleavage dioxygenase [Marinomonas transparens]MBJ7537329.1 intradiol ring-cleavage dioxygenase [Marinomonas transparens]